MITFTAILFELQAAIAVVAARDRRLTVLLVAVWGRIGRMRQRLERLITRWRAGTLQAPRKSRAGVASTAVRQPSIIPTAPAWLLVAVGEAAAFRAQLEHLLSQAECVEFLAAVPQAGRILRPLYRMLGIGVATTRRRRPRKVWAVPKAAPIAALSGLVMGPGGRFLYV